MVTDTQLRAIPPEWSSAIFNLRRRLGLSQSEFGSRLHYSAMAVSRWETGKQEPTSRCFIQLGNMAGQPECWLFWSRAGLKSADLRHMFPGAKAMARMTTSMDFEIVHAGSGAKRSRPKDAPKVQLVAVPLLEVHAGTLGQEGGAFTDFETAATDEVIAAPAFWCPNPEQTNCLRVKGTSMSPLINDGDVVAVTARKPIPRSSIKRSWLPGTAGAGFRWRASFPPTEFTYSNRKTASTPRSPSSATAIGKSWEGFCGGSARDPSEADLREC